MRAASDSSLELLEVVQALDRLGADQRTALLLAAVEGFTCREIADILAVPMGTVMSRLGRAREAMRELLLPRGGRTARRWCDELPRVKNLAPLYLSGEMHTDTRQRFAMHLAACPACAARSKNWHRWTSAWRRLSYANLRKQPGSSRQYAVTWRPPNRGGDRS